MRYYKDWTKYPIRGIKVSTISTCWRSRLSEWRLSRVVRNIGQKPQLRLSVIKQRNLPPSQCPALFTHLLCLVKASISSRLSALFFLGFLTHLFYLGTTAFRFQFGGVLFGAFQFQVDCLGIYDADNWSSVAAPSTLPLTLCRGVVTGT